LSLFSFFFTDGIYRIVYEEVDESDVKIFCFPSSNSNFGEVEEFR
jgi:dipeptidyl-peptidase 9